MLAFLFFCFIVVVWVRFRRVTAAVDGLSQRVAQLEVGGRPWRRLRQRVPSRAAPTVPEPVGTPPTPSHRYQLRSRPPSRPQSPGRTGPPHLSHPSHQSHPSHLPPVAPRTARDPRVPDRITLAALHRRHRHRRRRERTSSSSHSTTSGSRRRCASRWAERWERPSPMRARASCAPATRCTAR